MREWRKGRVDRDKGKERGMERREKEKERRRYIGQREEEKREREIYTIRKSYENVFLWLA